MLKATDSCNCDVNYKCNQQTTMDKEFRNNLSIRNVLIVGDGDYSFSVAFLMRYGALPITVTATTLEQGILMEQKYPNFTKNLEYLESHGESTLISSVIRVVMGTV